MEAVTEKVAVERELEIAARPETVWELLTDPDEAVRWMGLEASFDLRPGGEYRVKVLSGNVASGTFVEIDPPRRLVYTWGWEDGQLELRAAGLDDDRVRADRQRRRHAPPLQAQRPAEPRVGGLARTRLGSLLRAPRRGRRGRRSRDRPVDRGADGVSATTAR